MEELRIGIRVKVRRGGAGAGSASIEREPTQCHCAFTLPWISSSHLFGSSPIALFDVFSLLKSLSAAQNMHLSCHGCTGSHLKTAFLVAVGATKSFKIVLHARAFFIDFDGVLTAPRSSRFTLV